MTILISVKECENTFKKIKKSIVSSTYTLDSDSLYIACRCSEGRVYIGLNPGEVGIGSGMWT